MDNQFVVIQVAVWSTRELKN